jgi:hypothetical protein
MYKISNTHSKIVRYLVSNNFILDSGNTHLQKFHCECYYNFPISVTLYDDGLINIKDIANNRRYAFDDQQTLLTITHFIKFLQSTPNPILF